MNLLKQLKVREVAMFNRNKISELQRQIKDLRYELDVAREKAAKCEERYTSVIKEVRTLSNILTKFCRAIDILKKSYPEI